MGCDCPIDYYSQVMEKKDADRRLDEQARIEVKKRYKRVSRASLLDVICDLLLAQDAGAAALRTEPLEIEAKAVLEAICSVLEDKPISDFMASFPVVRRVMDLRAAPAPATGDLVARLRDRAASLCGLAPLMLDDEDELRGLLREAADTLEGK